MDINTNENDNDAEAATEEEITPSDAPFSLNKMWDDTQLDCYLDKDHKKRWRCFSGVS
jgi:hypothetical protein